MEQDVIEKHTFSEKPKKLIMTGTKINVCDPDKEMELYDIKNIEHSILKDLSCKLTFTTRDKKFEYIFDDESQAIIFKE